MKHKTKINLLPLQNISKNKQQHNGVTLVMSKEEYLKNTASNSNQSDLDKSSNVKP